MKEFNEYNKIKYIKSSWINNKVYPAASAILLYIPLVHSKWFVY